MPHWMRYTITVRLYVVWKVSAERLSGNLLNGIHKQQYTFFYLILIYPFTFNFFICFGIAHLLRQQPRGGEGCEC